MDSGQQFPATVALFEAMRHTYGNQWKHGSRSVPVWGRALLQYTDDEIRIAASRCVDSHPTYPPTIGEFKQLCRQQRPRATTYLPPPGKPLALRTANRRMVRVIVENASKELESRTIEAMISLKNALTEDWITDNGDSVPPVEWRDSLAGELQAVIDTHQSQRE